MPDTEDGKQSSAPINQSSPKWWTRFISYIKRKMHERHSKYENETAGDRAARVTTRATVWMAIFTAVLALVGVATLYEIIQGAPIRTTSPWPLKRKLTR